MKIAFAVEGEPRGKERPRFGNGQVYTPDKTTTYENQKNRQKE